MCGMELVYEWNGNTVFMDLHTKEFDVYNGYGEYMAHCVAFILAKEVAKR